MELPTSKYQALFRGLQQEMQSANLPVSAVRIPHATVIAAKIIDKKTSENWEELEAIQRIYQNFYCHHVKIQMQQGLNYREATLSALSTAEKTMAKIASKNLLVDALNEVEDQEIRKTIEESSSSVFEDLKVKALEFINQTSFKGSIIEVKLTNNGSVIFQLAPDDQLLNLRLDLIIAGEGISKWPNLSAMKHAWSTVAYTEKVIDSEEKAKIDHVIQNWVKHHQEELSSAVVKFDAKHLGSIAFRVNDFSSVKNAKFPLNNQVSVSLEDLKLSPGEISPIMGRRCRAEAEQTLWRRPINQEIKVK